MYICIYIYTEHILVIPPKQNAGFQWFLNTWHMVSLECWNGKGAKHLFSSLSMFPSMNIDGPMLKKCFKLSTGKLNGLKKANHPG